MTEAQSAVDVPPRVLEFLRAQDTLTLATASPAGVPRATTLRYVNDGVTLYVWMRSSATAARQLELNPLVSFTVASGGAGLQGSGECRLVLGGDETARAVELFADKYPTALGASTMNISFFRIAPTVMKLIDESYGGGRGETQAFGGAEYTVERVYDVLRDLPLEDVSIIAGKLRRVEVEAGQEVVREGAPADKFFIVLEGELEALRQEDGEARPVARLTGGDLFGEAAILRDKPRTATVRATTAATLLTMDRDDFRSVIAQALGAPEDFDRVIRERLGGGEPA